jgi:hypothetical protein
MKTTIELPEELFRRAKAAVARRGGTLREFFTRAAERELRRLEAGDRDRAPDWHRLLQEPSPDERKALDEVDSVVAEAFDDIDETTWL